LTFPDSANPAARRRGLLAVAIVLVALNLRPALASVGPVVGAIRDDTGLSHVAIGLLTTLPLLAFGLVSALTPFITRWFGIGGALAAGLILLCVGTALRTAPMAALLFGGTVLLGVGIALGNVLLPTLVKRDFPGSAGTLTSVYSSAMGAGATFAAGVSVPIAARLGWNGALGVWALPALIALLVWLPQRGQTSGRQGSTTGATLRSLARTRVAWQIALFMGLQSLTFYVILAWLPDVLQSRGLEASEAGWMLALSQATGVLGSAAVPLWAGRIDDQRAIVWFLAALEAAALGGLILTNPHTSAVWWVAVLGFALGGTFALALTLLVLRSPDTMTAAGLSGMAQSVGYLVAAAGPVLFGFLYEVTGAWLVPLLFLVVTLGGKLAAGVGAGRPGELPMST
jgi:MFS transporter, CP family, cyanate transporter